LRLNGDSGTSLGQFASTDSLSPADLQHDVGLSDLVFGPDGNLYANGFGFFLEPPDDHPDKVVKFDGTTGNLQGVFAQDGLRFAGGLAFGPDNNLYVGSWDTGLPGNVLKYDGRTGALIGPFLTNMESFPLQRPAALLFRTSLTSVSGGVFKDSLSTANVFPGANVHAAVEFVPSLFVCPFSNPSQPCPQSKTDNDGHYELRNLPPGVYELTAWPPDDPSLPPDAVPVLFPDSILVHIPSGSSAPITDQNLVLVNPTLPPDGTTVSPSTIPPIGPKVPVVFAHQAFDLTTPAPPFFCTDLSATYTLRRTSGLVIGSGSLNPQPDGTFKATIGPLYPAKGGVKVSIAFSCPGNGGPGFNKSFDFFMYIDPSGKVIDDVTGVPVTGATVTLFRSDNPHGPFTSVPDGSALMAPSNRKNPDMSNGSGQFGWDVVPGYYQLLASAPGFTCDVANPPHGFACVGDAIQSNVIVIPPAATDLILPLHSTQDVTPPVLSLPSNLTLEATGAAGAVATFTVTATDAVDGAMAVTCIPASGSTFALVITTVNCSASDAHHNTANGSFTVTVVDTTPPQLSMPANMTLLATSADGASASFTPVASDLVDGSVAAACTPASGSLFPIGTTTVLCSATDAHQNTSTGNFTVTVVYNICPLYTVTAKRSGSTYPIKLQICTTNGTNVSSPAITVHATGAEMVSTGASAPLDDSGQANPDMDFRYDPSLGGYIFNLSLNGYNPGTYDVIFTAGNDTTSHKAQYQVR
jgi:hypothetical protein